MRSLKERHEAELHSLQRELDSQAAVARRREREAEDASSRLAEVARAHDAAIVEKSDRIDELRYSAVSCVAFCSPIAIQICFHAAGRVEK